VTLAIEQIRTQVEQLDWLTETKPGKVADPAAWLVAAIRGDHAAPKGFVSKAERQRREEARQAQEREKVEQHRRQREQEARDRATREEVDAYLKRLTWSGGRSPPRGRIDPGRVTSPLSCPGPPRRITAAGGFAEGGAHQSDCQRRRKRQENRLPALPMPTHGTGTFPIADLDPQGADYRDHSQRRERSDSRGCQRGCTRSPSAVFGSTCLIACRISERSSRLRRRSKRSAICLAACLALGP
jgi:hypothetical protein